MQRVHEATGVVAVLIGVLVMGAYALAGSIQ